MKTPVLSSEELQQLLLVKTTIKQARQILKRNQALLEFLNKLPETWEEYQKYDGDILFEGTHGCPHCQEAEWCKLCKWGESNFFTCYNGQFGGYKLKQVVSGFVFVRYKKDCETCEIYTDVLESYFPIYLNDLNRCKIFVQGHIEWANAVIKKGRKK